MAQVSKNEIPWRLVFTVLAIVAIALLAIFLHPAFLALAGLLVPIFQGRPRQSDKALADVAARATATSDSNLEAVRSSVNGLSDTSGKLADDVKSVGSQVGTLADSLTSDKSATDNAIEQLSRGTESAASTTGSNVPGKSDAGG